MGKVFTGGQRGRRWLVAISTALLAVLTPLFFVAGQVYFPNAAEFAGTFFELETQVLAGAALIALALAVFVARGKTGRFERRVSVLLALGVLFWLQGNILLGEYGALDGRPVDWWRDNKVFAFLEVILWPSLLFAAWRFHRLIAPHALALSVLLLAIQSLALAGVAAKSSGVPQAQRYSLDESAKYAFSRERNVVLVVLDGFQSDVFAEIVKANPDYAQKLDGFVYFRNALAGYSKTYPSIPLLLTGEYYRNEQPIDEFTRDVFHERSVTRRLLEAGWRTDVFPLAQVTMPASPLIASNFVDGVFTAENLRSTGVLLDVAVLRVLPHFFKEAWTHDGRWRLRRYLPKWAGYRVHQTHAELTFLEEFEREAESTLAEPAFKFYHLNIPHAPFLVNERLELERLPANREGYLRQSAGALELLVRLIDKLKGEGIYDTTQLVVVADHGGGEYGAGVAPLPAPVTDETPECALGPSRFEHASGLPLFLVKPFANQGTLEVSDAPVSLGDVAATIAAAAGLPRHDAGRAVEEVAEAEQRLRHYYFYKFDGWEKHYLPDLKEFAVAGHSWREEAWCATGRVLKAAGEREREALEVELPLGESVRFTGAYSARAWLKQGWSVPEPELGLVWSSAPRAVLAISVHASWPNAIELTLDLQPFLARGRLPHQRVTVSANGRTLANWEVTRRGRYTLPLHLERDARDNVIHLELELPDARSPASYLISQDERRLGVALYALSFAAQ